MGKQLRESLAGIDLSTTDLDAINSLDPQMLNVLRTVKEWSNETVAHQNHNSHGDSHGGARQIEKELPAERATPAERAPAAPAQPAAPAKK